VGDPVVLVAAESVELAEVALRRIEVTYDPLPAVSNATEALLEDAPEIHEKGNLLMEKRVIRGDVSIGFSEAEAVVENTYETPFIEHAYLEPEAGIAYLDDSGRVVIESGSQDSHHIQGEVALFLGISHEGVRAIQIPVGGAFGGKIDVSVQCFLALVVHKLRRPAKMVYSREESFVASTKRHPFRIRLKHGAMKTGRLTALEGEMVVDTGGYASWGPNVLVRGLIHGTGPYEIPNVSLNGRLVYTNNPPAGAMRGFGVPQITFAIESQMDLLAEKLDLDPWEIRYRNALMAGSSTGTGQVLQGGVGMIKTLSAVRDFGDQSLESRSLSKKNARVKRGRGYGSMFYGIGYTATRNPSPIEIEITEDGFFHIYSGALDMGQGTATFLKQMAAEDLRAPFGRIRVTLADTDLTLDSRTTCASRTVYYSGNALRQAISSMKEAMFDVVTDLTGSMIDSYAIDDDHLVAGESRIPMTDLHRLFRERGLPLRFKAVFDPEVTGLDENGIGDPYVAYAYATQMADVEVDMETGDVRVLRVVSAHDVGRAINPLLVEEQIEGAVVMGLGYALMEEFVPAESMDFKKYRIPRFKDAPEIVSLIIEERDPNGPFGAKGVAECALIPTAASIANAIADALGERVYRLPADRAQIRALLGQRN
jgi:CO/xanthine dehydrogenase Mo-binding subunit